MILVDANLLIYAVNAEAEFHERAREWWQGVLSGTDEVGIPWLVALAFIRITTRRGIFDTPLTPEEALGYVDAWLAQPYATLLAPTEHHWRIFAAFCRRHGASGNLASDAHLAALAIEHGAAIYSVDHDFRRFEGIHHVDPIADHLGR